jgi:ferredoxin/flavodoxin---NADP+ reductase
VNVAGRPYVIAIVGAGPSGIYAAETLSQQTEVPVEIVVIDRLPVPFGLVRYGVAPDHESIRSIRNTLQRTLERPGVRFYGDVAIGSDLGVDELRGCVDAVIYAYGAGTDRRLGIPGEDLPGSIAAPELVAWYCGHPDIHPDHESPAGVDHLDAAAIDQLISRTTQAVVVGVGNVALDVARVLIMPTAQLLDTDMAEEVLESHARKGITDVHILGRRGPAHTSFTTKELREMGQLPDVEVIVRAADLELDPSSQAVVEQNKVAARNVAVLREWAGRRPTGASLRIHFHFWTRPVMIIGDQRVAAVRTERTMIDADGLVVGTRDFGTLAAQLVVRSVGYRGVALPGLPYDEGTGRVPHAEGRVIRDHAFSADEYVAGWIKRGPTGVIGTNKSDATETVNSLLGAIRDGAVVAHGRSGNLDRLLAARGIHPLDLQAWHRIDDAEIARGASHGRRRTTLAHRSELLAAAANPGQAEPGETSPPAAPEVPLAPSRDRALRTLTSSIARPPRPR